MIVDAWKRRWRRVRKALAGVLRHLPSFLARREVAPGRFEAGSASSWRGYVSTAPGAAPGRDYLVYVPRGWNRRVRAPLRVLCHGCNQTPENFAALTRLASHADREGTLVLLPRQSGAANAWGCWNWFEANTERGAGEAAIVAAQIVHVRRRYRARRERVFVGGFSAGGALAAVLGLRHPRLVRGILVHSGLACGAASSPARALSAMRQGPDTDVTRVGDIARAAARDGEASGVALLVVHGDRDDVVAPANASALVDQFLHFNGYATDKSDGLLPPSDASSREAGGTHYPVHTDDWIRNGRLEVRRVRIEGLGHAWSGGDPAYEYADAHGSDALDLLARFVADTG
jgi:poly(3-hydroxybutyrate) depolymerase